MNVRNVFAPLAVVCGLRGLLLVASPVAAKNGPTTDELRRQRSAAQQAIQAARNANDEKALRAAYESLAKIERQKVAAAKTPTETNTSRAELAGTLESLADLYEDSDEFPAAEEALRERLELQTARLGKEHWEVTDARVSLHNLQAKRSLTAENRRRLRQAHDLNGRMTRLYGQGQYGAAAQLAEQALQIHKTVLGERHPDTAVSLSDLGQLYQSQGDYPKAEPLLKQAWEINKTVLGERHPATAGSLNILAGLYDSQGEYRKAEQLYQQALKIRQAVLGERHPDTAVSLNNLAGVYESQGGYGKAEQLYQQALEINKAALGERHPATATTFNNLAFLYKSQGKFTKAETIYRQALEIRTATLGKRHPDTLVSLNNLGKLYQTQGEYSKAEPLLKEAAEISKTVLGERNLTTAIALSNLAGVYDAQGDYSKAESLFKQALNIRKAVLGERHPDTAATLNNLALLYKRQGEYAKAESLYQQTLEIYKAALGERRPNTAISLNNLALLYESQGEYAKAEPLLKQSMEISKAALGERHPNTATGLHNLGMAYQAQGKFANAETVYQQALDTRKAVLGEGHPDSADSMNNLGLVYQAQGQFAKAEPLFERALEGQLEFSRLNAAAQSAAAARRFLQTRFYGADDALLSVRRRLPMIDARATYGWVWRSRGLASQLQSEQRELLSQAGQGAEVVQKLRSVNRRLAQLTLATVSPEAAPRRRERLQQLNDEKEALERELAKVSGEYRRRVEVQRATPRDLLGLLPEDTMVVHLAEVTVWSPSKTTASGLTRSREYDAFVLRKTAAEPGWSVAWLHLGPAQVINNAVTDWLSRIDEDRDAVRADDHPASLLRERVWRPLEEHLAGVQHIVVIPDSKLCFVPWAALPGRSAGAFLLEDYALSVAQSGQELYRQLTEPPSQKESALLVGGVNYDARGANPGSPTTTKQEPLLAHSRGVPLAPAARPEWKFLAGSQQEIEALTKLWPRGADMRLLSGVKAGEMALPQASYVHLATHGFFADKRFRSWFQHDEQAERLFGPAEMEAADLGAADLSAGGKATVTGRNPLLLSGVVLAGANLPPELDNLGLPTGADGVLTAEEVVNLDLNGAELVVLSACDTGRGTEVGGGEGVFGLQRAFHQAGARCVLASLWKVDDEATQALMTEFYQNLWQKKLGKMAAMRAAQLKMIRDYNPTDGTIRGLKLVVRTRSGAKGPQSLPPFYWAAFQLSGDWR